MHPKVVLLTTTATVLVALAAIPAAAQDPPASATAKCSDGTYSTSVSRRGACSNHGGVAEWLVPADATAICRDGTYSFSRSRQGTCANHGGVAEWMEVSSDGDYVTAMKDDLRNLVTAEEVFFADSVNTPPRSGAWTIQSRPATLRPASRSLRMGGGQRSVA